MKTVWTAANAIMALMFGFSVAVQVNDPDPLWWIAIYAAATAVCVAETIRRTPIWAPAGVAAAALVWAATLAPRVIGKVPFMEMFAEFEMQNVGVEESREMYGLLLIAGWMAAVAIAVVRRGRPAAARSGP